MDDTETSNLDFTTTEGGSSGSEELINSEELPSDIRDFLSQAVTDIEAAILNLEQALKSDLIKEPSWQMLAHLYLGVNRLENFNSLNKRHEETFGKPISVSPPMQEMQIDSDRVVFDMPNKIVCGSLPDITLVGEGCASSKGAMLNFANVHGADTGGLKELAEFFKKLPHDQTKPVISGIDHFITSLEKVANDSSGTQEMWDLLFEYCRFCDDIDTFDELAIKFAIRFSISPPSW
jgi:hypothetical protein